MRRAPEFPWWWRLSRCGNSVRLAPFSKTKKPDGAGRQVLGAENILVALTPFTAVTATVAAATAFAWRTVFARARDVHCDLAALEILVVKLLDGSQRIGVRAELDERQTGCARNNR